MQTPNRHPIFDSWAGRQEDCPPEFDLEYPGVLQRREFFGSLPASPTGHRLAYAGPPRVDEEYFEWIDVFESVAAADVRFCMAELGAGFGRWLVRATVALRRLKPYVEPYLIGVEAEPTHFRWMRTHFRDNGIDPDAHRLVEAAVDAQEGEVSFTVGRADKWYGQAVVPPETPGYDLVQIRSTTLSKLIEDVEVVDLVDLDVQGAELRVLESAIEDLDRKAKRVHIGTHSDDVEVGLRELFGGRGWLKRWDFRIGHTEKTHFGEVDFADGVQTWINPEFDANLKKGRVRSNR